MKLCNIKLIIHVKITELIIIKLLTFSVCYSSNFPLFSYLIFPTIPVCFAQNYNSQENHHMLNCTNTLHCSRIEYKYIIYVYQISMYSLFLGLYLAHFTLCLWVELLNSSGYRKLFKVNIPSVVVTKFCFLYQQYFLCIQFFIIRMRWRKSLTAKRIFCSSGGSRFDSQHPPTQTTHNCLYFQFPWM